MDGCIVGFNWLRLHSAVGAAAVPMLLRDDEVYTTDAFTDPARRGLGIHPALNHAMLQFARDQGYRVAYTLARADNDSSLVTMQRLGWTLSGRLLHFEPHDENGRERWLVSGSAYPMPVGPLVRLRVPALAEIHQRMGFDGQQLIQALPWCNTYRLAKGPQAFDLQIVPVELAAGLRAAVKVAQAFPEQVPPVTACNYASESWILSQAPASPVLDDQTSAQALQTMLQTYATLQARATQLPDLLRALPAAPLDEGVEKLLACLQAEAPADSRSLAAAGSSAPHPGARQPAAQTRRCGP
jgi:GNAT superfamily N-acetyltransferase